MGDPISNFFSPPHGTQDPGLGWIIINEPLIILGAILFFVGIPLLIYVLGTWLMGLGERRRWPGFFDPDPMPSLSVSRRPAPEPPDEAPPSPSPLPEL